MTLHVVGISSQAAGHKTLEPKLDRRALKAEGAGDIIVIAAAVIPLSGLSSSFRTPGRQGDLRSRCTNIPAAARDILELIPRGPAAA